MDGFPEPHDKKFNIYGGPEGLIDTELTGVVLAPGADLFVVPDPNYLYLAIEGNRRRPAEGEYCYERWQEVLAGANPSAFLKLEMYGVGGRPGGEPPSAPMVNDHGTMRPVRRGDHIRISGLYVHDFAHPMLSHKFSGSFGYGRGLLWAAFGHAELHPYNYYSIELLDTASTEPLQSQVHTFVAPIYTQIYAEASDPPTHIVGNRLNGVGNHLVEDSKESTRTANFHLAPPAQARSGRV